MPFTVEDFEDLLRLLYERPEWQERLRRAILPPELFELPRIAQELVDANRAERERVAGLEAEQQAARQELRDGFAQTGQRLDRVETELADFRAETTAGFEQVDARFNRVDARFDRVDARFEQVDARFEQVDARFEQVDARFDRVDARLEQVDARFDRVDARFDRVDAHLEQADARFDRMDGRIQQLSTDLGTLKGIGMEERLRGRVPQFRHLVPEPVALTSAEVAALLDGEIAAGRLAPGEARQVERTDLILRSSGSGVSPYLVVEVSWLVDERDVRRAHDRATLLRKAGYDARGAVTGTRIQPDAVALAERLGVERMIDEEGDEPDEAESVVEDGSR